ncbi:transmembrane protein [Cystoisospora suis]|uniref:Transmembrane protein n=1 Tax=Cystoisospora suis TaxID=483139 RepID=A0A2C6J4Z7_9APIC|nr:transmembrane protein [Cystoisospora suis]
MTSDSAPAASQQGVGRLEVESSDDHNVRPFLAVQPQMQSQTKQQRPTINVTEEKAGTPAGRKHGDMSGPTVTTATPTVEKGKDEQNGAEAEAVVLEDLPENNSKRRKRDGAQRPASELEKRGGKQGAAKDQQEAFLSRDKTAVAGTRVGSSIKPEISGDDRTTKTSEGTQGKKEIVPNSVPPTDSEVVQILKSKGLDELMNAKTFDDLRRILGPYMKVTLKDALAFKELSEKLKESGVQEAEIRGMMATEAKPWKTIAASIGLSEKSTETLERCLSQLVAK